MNDKWTYEKNLAEHFDSFYWALKRFQEGISDHIPYGETSGDKHKVWLGEGTFGSPVILFSVKELRAAKTRRKVLNLWDVAYAEHLLVTQ